MFLDKKDDKMKKLTIFQNAYKMHQGGFCRETDRSETKIYYEAEDLVSKKVHMVIISLTDKKTISASCDCTIASMKAEQNPICSHMMTCIMRSVFDNGRRKERFVED